MIFKATSRSARWGRLLFLPYFGCRCSRLPEINSLLLVFVSLWFAYMPNATGASLQLSSDNEIASAGYFQLQWHGPAGEYLLHESSTPEFTTSKNIYRGSDTASVISGKPDGEYYYRVSLDNGSQPQRSNILKVTVSHHTLTQALLFFFAGAVVFLTILIMIIQGSRQPANQ